MTIYSDERATLEARVRLLEIRLEELRRIQQAQSVSLNENTLRDSETRRLIEDVRNLKGQGKTMKKRQLQGSGVVVIMCVAFYLTAQIEANQLIGGLISLGTAAGWWIGIERHESD